jgi:hypothetical protein
MSLTARLVVTGFFALLVWMGMRGTKKPQTGQVTQAGLAQPPLPSFAPRSVDDLPVDKASIGLLSTLKGPRLSCVQAEAPDAATLKAKLEKMLKGKSTGLQLRAEKLEGIRSEFLEHWKKKHAEGAAAGIAWSALEVCPADGILTSCAFETATILGYDLDVVEDDKKECLGRKGQWAETPQYAEALSNRPIKASAPELQKAYEDNEVQADMRYKGRRLQVTGTVASISKDVLDKPFLSLAGGEMFSSVLANGLPESQLARLHKGDRVTVVCQGAGMTLRSAVLRDCSFKD